MWVQLEWDLVFVVVGLDLKPRVMELLGGEIDSKQETSAPVAVLVLALDL